MNDLKYVFFGATNYSKALLLFLIDNNIIPAAIFSIPREFNISYSKKKVINSNYANLKGIANNYKIPHYEVDSVKGKKMMDYFKVIRSLNLDLILALGWYYMIPKKIRGLAKYGAWGIHASLLPKYAGGAPLNWAIINGEKETGVTLFRMDDGVDDGDIIIQKSFPIKYEDSIKDVYEKATVVSTKILKQTLQNINGVKFEPQDKSKIKVYPQRTPEDGAINLSQSSKDIYNFIRAQSSPYPGAFCKFENDKMIIWDAQVVEKDKNICSVPGQITMIGEGFIEVACGEGKIRISLIEIESNLMTPDKYVKSIRTRFK